MRGRELWTGALRVDAVFAFPRPGYHFAKRRGLVVGLKPDAPRYHDKKPDLDKLIRIADALTGIVWTDDALVSEWHAPKLYAVPGADGLGLLVSISPLPRPPLPETAKIDHG